MKKQRQRSTCYPDIDIDTNFNNEEEIKKYHETKDKSLREKIILNNMPLLFKLVSEYKYASKIDASDLVSVGTIGLITAIEKFDLNNGCKFTTYAHTSIKNAILNEIEKWYGEGNLYYGQLMMRFKQLAIPIYGDNSDIYKLDNINYILEIMLEEESIRPGAVKEVRSRLLSLDPNVDIEEIENVAYEEDDFDRIDFIKTYKDSIYETLTDHEKELIDYKCGFKDGIPHNQVEISQIFGNTHQAVHLQEKKAISKMKIKANKLL